MSAIGVACVLLVLRLILCLVGMGLEQWGGSTLGSVGTADAAPAVTLPLWACP